MVCALATHHAHAALTGMSEVDKPIKAFPDEVRELQTDGGGLKCRTVLKFCFDDRNGPFSTISSLFVSKSGTWCVVQVPPFPQRPPSFWLPMPLRNRGRFLSCSLTKRRDHCVPHAVNDLRPVYHGPDTCPHANRWADRLAWDGRGPEPAGAQAFTAKQLALKQPIMRRCRQTKLYGCGKVSAFSGSSRYCPECTDKREVTLREKAEAKASREQAKQSKAAARKASEQAKQSKPARGKRVRAETGPQLPEREQEQMAAPPKVQRKRTPAAPALKRPRRATVDSTAAQLLAAQLQMESGSEDEPSNYDESDNESDDESDDERR